MQTKISNILNSLTDEIINTLAEHFQIPEAQVGAARADIKNHDILKKVPMPFTGLIDSHKCKAIRVNHGLFTQCLNQPSNGYYCVTCAKKVKNGIPEHGNIHSRKLSDWVSPSGRTPLPYRHVLDKLHIEMSEAEQAASLLGISIASYTAEKSEVKRGRPAKEKRQLRKALGNNIISQILEIARSNPDSVPDTVEGLEVPV